MGSGDDHSLDGQSIVTGICVNGLVAVILIAAATMVGASIAVQAGVFDPIASQTALMMQLPH